MRRPLSILILLVFYASLFEVGVGLARDGAVHHESTATAVSHATQAQGQGEHGHETGEDSPDSEHGPDHQHGTSSDHCTHAHGSALTAATTWAPAAVELASLPATSFPTPSDRPSVPLWHPPRA